MMCQLSIQEILPPLWRVRETAGSSGVDDSTGSNLLHVFGDVVLRGSVMDLLTCAEARPVALVIARLPSLIDGVGG